MKNINSSINNQNTLNKELRTKHKYQILENYWKKRKKECEKNLSKYC